MFSWPKFMLSLDVLLVIFCNISLVGWSTRHTDIWLLAAAGAIFLFTYDHVYHIWTSTFLTKTLAKLSRVDCCIHSLPFQHASTALRLLCCIRTLAGLTATIGAILGWAYGFSKDNTLRMCIVWSSASILWLVSCVPMLVTLLQCAAVATKNKDIFRFRGFVTIWLIHDITLGGFWSYLAIALPDIVDDNDDSEWCTIFLSMISWHIVVLTVQTFFIDSSWKHNDKDDSKPGPCCGAKSAVAWWRALHFVCMGVVYIVVVQRVQEHHLDNMGLSVSASLVFGFCIVSIIFSRRILLGSGSKSKQRAVRTENEAIYPNSSHGILAF